MSDNAIKGFTVYKDVMLQQHEKFDVYFKKFLEDEQFENIVEVGAGTGCLTRFIREHSNPVKMSTYNLPPIFLKPVLTGLGVKVVEKDTFGEKGTPNYMKDIDSEIKSDIIGSLKTLVLCDGGNKLFEFKQCAPLLKPGDFIMAHDFCRSRDLFTEEYKKTVWGWCELTEKDIEPTCIENNLVDYEKLNFNDIVWTCKYKRA